MNNRKEVGIYYEKIACDVLESLNYEILLKNIYVNHLEIDVIARKNNTIFFFEVRKRKNFQLPIISRNKITNLYNACERWILKNKLINNEFVISLIVFFNESQYEIIHNLTNSV